MPIQDETVLVTGATGGIGKQTTLVLAQPGARVIVTGRSQASGEAAASEPSELSGNDRVGLLPADLSTRAGVPSLAGRRPFSMRRRVDSSGRSRSG